MPEQLVFWVKTDRDDTVYLYFDISENTARDLRDPYRINVVITEFMFSHVYINSEEARDDSKQVERIARKMAQSVIFRYDKNVHMLTATFTHIKQKITTFAVLFQTEKIILNELPVFSCSLEKLKELDKWMLPEKPSHESGNFQLLVNDGEFNTLMISFNLPFSVIRSIQKERTITIGRLPVVSVSYLLTDEQNFDLVDDIVNIEKFSQLFGSDIVYSGMTNNIQFENFAWKVPVIHAKDTIISTVNQDKLFDILGSIHDILAKRHYR